MLIIEKNSSKKNEYIIFTFKAELSLDAIVVFILRLFLGNQSILHFGFNLFWPVERDNRKNM